LLNSAQSVRGKIELADDSRAILFSAHIAGLGFNSRHHRQAAFQILWRAFYQFGLPLSNSDWLPQISANPAGSNRMNLLCLSNLPASAYLFLDPAGDGEPAGEPARFYRAFMQ
jgi:hypothetical protein